MALEQELETFKRLMAGALAAEEGRYAVIAGDELLGVFDSCNDAINAGYRERGLLPFLVKKVAAVEAVFIAAR